MTRFTFIIALALLAVSLAPITSHANAITKQQARTEHMRACLSNGGKKDICKCSFDRSLQSLSAEALLNVNRALTNKIPANKQHLDLLSKTTKKCASDVQDGLYDPAAEAFQASSNTAQPPFPSLPAPTFADLDSMKIPAPPELTKSSPDFAAENSAGYFEEEVIDEEQLKAAAEAEAARKRAAAVKVNNLRKSYKGQHNNLVFRSAANGDLNALKASNQYLPTVDILDKSGDTPLMIAAKYGQAAAMNFFFAQGANPKHTNSQGQQAIHLATFSRQREAVLLLLRNKVDVNVTYAGGFAPLHLALMNGDEPLLQSLIIAGADVNLALENGDLPIHIAAATSTPVFINILNNYGADLNAENAQGYTPLLMAMEANNAQNVSALLAMGADYNYPDVYGRTPLQLAYAMQNQQIINLLLTMRERSLGGF